MKSRKFTDKQLAEKIGRAIDSLNRVIDAAREAGLDVTPASCGGITHTAQVSRRYDVPYDEDE